MPQLQKHWDHIGSSFWFLPSILVGGSVLTAYAVLALDETVSDRWLKQWNWGWIYTGSAEGASTVLGTIAGSMATIAGVVFSLTLVSLTLASSQFGPRLLRNFMRDTTNQAVIGTFVSTFLYCLIVLRSIRREDAGSFVPQLSVSLGVVFALVSIGVLIYFIHHVSMSIQADEVVARVASELIEGIDRIFPEEIGKGDPRKGADFSDAHLPQDFDREARPVMANGDGYVQLIDQEVLLKVAVREDVIFRVERRPGHYVIAGSPLLRVWPGDRQSDRFDSDVNAAFALGSRRTPVQDIEFSIDQLVEVAMRALSPGVNDPFTAITCIDRLGSALSRLSKREMPSAFRLDEEDRLRVIAPPVNFPSLVDAAFNQIRQAARSNVAVTIRLLETIARIAEFACQPEDRMALLRHAGMIVRGARENFPEEEDRRSVEERYRAIVKSLGDSGGLVTDKR